MVLEVRAGSECYLNYKKYLDTTHTFYIAEQGSPCHMTRTIRQPVWSKPLLFSVPPVTVPVLQDIPHTSHGSSRQMAVSIHYSAHKLALLKLVAHGDTVLFILVLHTINRTFDDAEIVL